MAWFETEKWRWKKYTIIRDCLLQWLLFQMLNFRQPNRNNERRDLIKLSNTISSTNRFNRGNVASNPVGVVS